MRIAIGSDHAGFTAKESLSVELRKEHEVIDCGTGSEDSVDYPDFAKKVSELVASGEAERGILICGTGIGMSMAANKISGIRAAVCNDIRTATLSREHNDANVLCMGGRLLNERKIIDIAKKWLETDFRNGRHKKRVEKINALEG